MIFLLNKQRVLTECLQLAKIKIAEKLGMEMSQVEVGVTRKDDRNLVPSFRLSEQTQFGTKEEIDACIKTVWEDVKNKISERIEGLTSRRYDR